MLYITVDADIRAKIIEWKKKHRNPKFVVMGIQHYDDLCSLLKDYFPPSHDFDEASNEFLLSEFMGLKIIVVESEILEVVLEPDEMFIVAKSEV